MAASRGRGLRPGGVVRALGRLFLLIGFGFAAGLLIGVLLEEPELLAGHLRGEGEAIVLTPPPEDAASAVLVSSEQGIGSGEDERRAVMEPRSQETANAGLPAVAASPEVKLADSKRDRLWAVQVGAFSDEGSAVRLAESLGAKGYTAELLVANGDSQRWRVRIQPVRSEAKAREIAGRLKRVERLPTWVLPMEGHPR